MTDGDGSLTEREVQRILGLIEALERSSFDACELEVDGIKLTLGRGTAGNSASGGLPRTVHPVAPAPAAPAADQRKKAVPQPGPAGGKTAGPPATAGRAAPSNAADVLAPLKGIFYGRPDPASPPFVTIGARVSAITTIGLVEVMKVFNAVAAGHAGTVAEICVEDGNAVNSGQVLIRIVPDASPGA